MLLKLCLQFFTCITIHATDFGGKHVMVSEIVKVDEFKNLGSTIESNALWTREVKKRVVGWD